MELTGSIKGISSDYLTKKFQISLEINEEKRLIEGYSALKDVNLLDISIKKHRKRRSLNANAYFHVLVSKLADCLGISKVRCKNMMVGRYGQPFILDNGAEAVIKTNIPASHMLENETVHCMPCGSKTEDGKEYVYYKVFRGSSTYDTKEMSILVDGVVSECQEQGIETLPPAELERMLKMWKVSGGGRE